MKSFIAIHKSGDRTLTFKKRGKYLVLLKNVSGVFRFEISAPQVDLTILGTYEGQKEEAYTLQTVQHHTSSNSTSHLFIKGVFEGASQFTYHGLIRIEENCNGSHAYQKNQNLVLSPHVRVISEPDLEILSHDVFCTHGSTTGGINSDSQYYLQTRGLSEKKAAKLIKEGFLREIYDLARCHNEKEAGDKIGI